MQNDRIRHPSSGAKKIELLITGVEKLKKHGYNYYGSEPMYSGVSGRLFKADLYIGMVYYQRLRHMVSDKYQVRSIGPIDNVTGQPVKEETRWT
eukprot:UN05342